MAIDLLAGLNLSHVVVTADALHAQRVTATFIVEHGGQFVFLVKNNQPNLFAALDTLP
jgi:predicted transposase YbfD/YdcC